MPTQEIIRLMLKAFDFLEYLLTKTTDMPEASAESNARAEPIMFFLEVGGGIKGIFSLRFLRMDDFDNGEKAWSRELNCTLQVNSYLRERMLTAICLKLRH